MAKKLELSQINHQQIDQIRLTWMMGIMTQNLPQEKAREYSIAQKE